jgi:hypothetical protein
MCKNLLNGISNEKKEVKFDKRVLLIDEVDVFFSDDFYCETYDPAFCF